MLAVTLRGFAGSRMSSLLHLLAASADVMLVAWWVRIDLTDIIWYRDGWHAMAMGAVMLALLPLMQGAWLRADLVRLAAKAQEPTEPTEPTEWER